uniref:Uncharacterized protein n=1 Tax=Plectus sambesii TaxID=2011161 RepID=A0A914XGT8_9BILA
MKAGEQLSSADDVALTSGRRRPGAAKRSHEKCSPRRSRAAWQSGERKKDNAGAEKGPDSVRESGKGARGHSDEISDDAVEQPYRVRQPTEEAYCREEGPSFEDPDSGSCGEAGKMLGNFFYAYASQQPCAD